MKERPKWLFVYTDIKAKMTSNFLVVQGLFYSDMFNEVITGDCWCDGSLVSDWQLSQRHSNSFSPIHPYLSNYDYYLPIENVIPDAETCEIEWHNIEEKTPLNNKELLIYFPEIQVITKALFDYQFYRNTFIGRQTVDNRHNVKHWCYFDDVKPMLSEISEVEQ